MDEDMKQRAASEWDYVSKIQLTVGCITPALMGHKQNNTADIKRHLTKAKQEGLDPARIYRAVLAVPGAITKRMPPWEEVKPD